MRRTSVDGGARLGSGETPGNAGRRSACSKLRMPPRLVSVLFRLKGVWIQFIVCIVASIWCDMALSRWGRLYRTVLSHMTCTEARRMRGEGRPRESEKCFKARMPRRKAAILDVLTSFGGREAATIKRARRETAPAPPVVHTGPSVSEFRQSHRLSSRPFARSGRCRVRELVRGRTHRKERGSSQSFGYVQGNAGMSRNRRETETSPSGEPEYVKSRMKAEAKEREEGAAAGPDA